jgi:hypothetical protein
MHHANQSIHFGDPSIALDWIVQVSYPMYRIRDLMLKHVTSLGRNT